MYRLVVGLCVAQIFFFGMIFLVNIMTGEHFFGKKNFFYFYVVILKNTMKGFMINFFNFMKYIYKK